MKHLSEGEGSKVLLLREGFRMRIDKVFILPQIHAGFSDNLM
jgi:hypothetical protein